MPPIGRPPTGKKAVFLEAMARTGDATYSADKAGYSDPSNAGSSIMARPNIRAEIADIRTGAHGELVALLPGIVTEMKRRLHDPKTTNREFTGLATLAFKYGFPQNEDGSAKEIHEMNPTELARAIDAMERQSAAMAKIVQGEVIEEQPDPGVFG